MLSSLCVGALSKHQQLICLVNLAFKTNAERYREQDATAVCVCVCIFIIRNPRTHTEGLVLRASMKQRHRREQLPPPRVHRALRSFLACVWKLIIKGGRAQLPGISFLSPTAPLFHRLTRRAAKNAYLIGGLNGDRGKKYSN
jgi:hypothetical protein